jgi:cytochrome P450
MQRDPIGFLSRLAREYGDVVHFTFGLQHLYFFNHPDLIREVLVSQARSFEKGRALKRSKVILGEGLLTSEHDVHKRQRRLAQPAFHRDRVSRYAEVMIERAVRTRERWHDGEVIDVHQQMMGLTLSIVASTLFGAQVDDQADDIAGALTELMEMFPLLLVPFAEVLQHLPLPQTLRFRRAIRRLDRTIYSIIDERRASGEDRGDLLSMLLLAQDEEGDGGGMTDKQVRDEAMTLFLAGHETTANALAWTWYLLAQHPEVERELHHELDSVLGERLPVPGDYSRLPYTEMVLAESMRLYPPAYSVGRLAIEDVTVGDTRMRRGAIAVLSQWVTHRDPRWWPDPDRFDPLRFTPQAKASRPKMSYFPFGGGPRICIGESFAWMEGVLLMATIAQRFRMDLISHDVKCHPLITLRPRGGITMRCQRRAAAGPGT